MKRKHATHPGSGERRRQILMAALSCFNELGFTEAGISNICRRSGASIGSMYHHFKSKEQLAAAVYMEGIVQYQDGLLNALERVTDPEGGIRAIIGFHLHWVVENPEWSRFLFQKRHEAFMTGTVEELSRRNKAFAQGISQWFGRHAAAGSIRKMAWDIYIAIVLGPCQEFARLLLSGKAVSSVDEAVVALSRAAWQALSTEGATAGKSEGIGG